MNSIRLRQIHWDEIQDHLERCLPFEGCGLLAGQRQLVTDVQPVTNVMRSETTYRMDAGEQVRALFGFEAENLDLIAIYHSHPSGPEMPSESDRQQASYPDVAHLICCRGNGGWSARAFRIGSAGEVKEIAVDWLK
jgi:proteasome lid subunit RPN8/RPN11